MKTTYYLAMSLDGLIADTEHGVGWLDQVRIDQEASDYHEFFASVDGLVMGRKTYDFVYNYGQWPYQDRPTWVCSTREVPAMEGCNLEKERDPISAISAAREQGLSNLWIVGGGKLASDLLDAGQLTHLSVSVMPILLGDGIRLVDSLKEPVFLEQENARAQGGFTQVEYRVVKC